MLFRPPEFNFKYNKRSAQAHLRLRTNPQSPFQFSSIFVCFILFAGVLSSVDQPPVDSRRQLACESTKLPWAGSIRLRRPTPVDRRPTPVDRRPTPVDRRPTPVYRRHHSAYNSAKLHWARYDPIHFNRRSTPYSFGVDNILHSTKHYS